MLLMLGTTIATQAQQPVLTMEKAIEIALEIMLA